MKKFGLFLIFLGLLFLTTVVMAYSKAIVVQADGQNKTYICCSCRKGAGYWWKNQWVLNQTCRAACGKGWAEKSDACTINSKIFGDPPGTKDRTIVKFQ